MDFHYDFDLSSKDVDMGKIDQTIDMMTQPSEQTQLYYITQLADDYRDGGPSKAGTHRKEMARAIKARIANTQVYFVPGSTSRIQAEFHHDSMDAFSNIFEHVSFLSRIAQRLRTDESKNYEKTFDAIFTDFSLSPPDTSMHHVMTQVKNVSDSEQRFRLYKLARLPFQALGFHTFSYKSMVSMPLFVKNNTLEHRMNHIPHGYMSSEKLRRDLLSALDTSPLDMQTYQEALWSALRQGAQDGLGSDSPWLAQQRATVTDFIRAIPTEYAFLQVEKALTSIWSNTNYPRLLVDNTFTPYSGPLSPGEMPPPDGLPPTQPPPSAKPSENLEYYLAAGLLLVIGASLALDM